MMITSATKLLVLAPILFSEFKHPSLMKQSDVAFTFIRTTEICVLERSFYVKCSAG